jgi:regulator of protease activity HflC (stomatin/prohibitin superfamily)
MSSNKKRSSLGFFGAAILLIFIFCWLFFFKMISPGYVGVVVDLFGDSKGVETKELHVGVHWIAPWKTVYQFPIFEQNHTWEGREAFNFQTSEGLAISADIGITFHIRPNSIPNIFAKYRRGMDEITHTFIRNYIRDAINRFASKMKIEDLYGESKEIFFEQVQNQVREELRGVGFEISRIYLIGRFHFPETVVAALNQKIEAIQRAQQRENELREAEAEAKKQVAKASGQAQCVLLQAESEAKANTILSQSVTAELIQWQAVQKWDGKLPTVTSGATPFIQVK